MLLELNQQQYLSAPSQCPQLYIYLLVVCSIRAEVMILVHYQDLNTVIKTHRKIMIPAVVELLVLVDCTTTTLPSWSLGLEPG